MQVEAYLVRHLFNGKPNKFITMDRNRAEKYAEEHHGTIHFLVELVEEPVVIEESQVDV